MVNSSATIARAMKKLLEGMQNVDHFVDDILVHNSSWEEHLRMVHEVLQKMSHAKLTARPYKTVVDAKAIHFVGCRVGNGTSSPLQDNVCKVREAARPRTKKEVRSFIGLTGFYRHYVPNYVAIAAPLTNLTNKGQPNREWENAQETLTQQMHLKWDWCYRYAGT